MTDFEPRILGFLCNWCAYAGADLAGVSRVQYPTNMRVIRVMCSGRIDPLLVLKAFKDGMDGVAVLGCHPGDCHYQTGNYQAENKMEMTKRVLEKIGIQPGRLYLDWVSAAEGVRFGEVVTGFIESIRELGPIHDTLNLGERATIGEHIVEVERLRWLVGKERELLETGNVYNEKVDGREFKDILWLNIVKEYDKERLCASIRNTPRTVHDLARELDLPKSSVFRYLTGLENEGLVTLTDFQDRSPRYILTQQVGNGQ